MKLLHINSYYSDNHLYKEIYTRLDADYEQTIYIPQKKGIGRKNEIELHNGNLVYEDIFSTCDRFLFFSKLRKAFRELNGLQLFPQFIHAHNLSTDGVLAYRMHKAIGVDYIVAVRLTDIILQYKYFFYRRATLNKVLAAAKKIVFISPIQLPQLLKYINDEELKRNIENKAIAIPNGVNNYWLDHKVTTPKKTTSHSVNLLFVGRIVKVKNVLRLLQAVELVEKQGYDIKITIIGGKYHLEHDYFEKFMSLIAGKKYINYMGEIWDKDVIRKAYTEADIFVMPSLNELFGLTYIESISQNVPVVYSKGSGIMPYLEGKPFAECVDQLSVESIADGIINLMSRVGNLGVFSSFADDYNWDNIINKYKRLYNE